VDPVLSTSIQGPSERQFPSYGALATELVRTNNVTVEQTTVLGERRTVVVSVRPHSNEKTDTDDRVERRLWIDSERLIPLQIETTWTRADGQTVTETVRYSNVTFGERGATQSTTESRGVSA
jgi:outer membrane lipoprotein-sorting protein